jgi:hypothetical protein
MARGNEKIFFLILFLLFFCSRGQDGLRAQGADTSALLKDFRLPQYNQKTGKPEFILYGKEADGMGVVIKLKGMLVDVLSREIKDMSKVRNMEKVELYDIDTDSGKVIDFWADKPHSMVLIRTPQADYDRSTKIISGKQKIRLRSHFLDIDGVGFVADHNKQLMHIDKDVKVVYRSSIYEKESREKKEREKRGKNKKSVKKAKGN